MSDEAAAEKAAAEKAAAEKAAAEKAAAEKADQITWALSDHEVNYPFAKDKWASKDQSND